MCWMGRKKGLRTPLAPDASDPWISALLDEFSYVFKEPVFVPSDCITHDITLLDPDAQPPKHKQYRLSPKTSVSLEAFGVSL